MIPHWQAELADSFTDPGVLLSHLGLSEADFPGLRAADQRFPFKVTRAYVQRIRKHDPRDPLLLQVLPAAQELMERPGYGTDPVGDREAVVAAGLLHKYQGRALLIVTGGCAIHCRYCFRREFPYEENQLSKRREQAAFDHLAADHSLREVILSGGDPLMLSDERLLRLIGRLETIPHLTRLRIHTRLPVVLPSRITEPLMESLETSRFSVAFVIHANHPNELDEPLKQALRRLAGRGITLLNQAVLLRGINDTLETQIALSESLFEAGVLPYYLHRLDRVRGGAHFDCDEADARALLEGLRRSLPGYLVPRLVREEAGKAYKTPSD